MSAASSLLKPFAGFQLASRDAVAIAIAETNVELSPDDTLSGGSEIPAKSLAPILTHAEPLMEAVSEIVLGVRVAGRRRDSEPLHRDAPRPRNSEAVSIPQSKVVLRDIMVGHGRLVIPEHRSPCVSTNAASEVITRTQIESGAHMSLFGRGLPHAERSFQVPTAFVLAEGKPISQPELSVRVSIRRQLRQCACGDHDSGAVRSSVPNRPHAGAAVQRAVGLAAEPTRQPSTATANARWALLATLPEEIGRLRIVAVFSCPSEQTLDFSPIAYDTPIEKRDSKMILSFLAAVRRRVVGSDGPSVGPDGGRRIPASSYSVLKTVTDLEPGITVLRASRTSPPLKGSPEVAQFSVCSRDVVRCGCVPEAKLVPQFTNRDSMSVQITHELVSDTVQDFGLNHLTTEGERRGEQGPAGCSPLWTTCCRPV